MVLVSWVFSSPFSLSVSVRNYFFMCHTSFALQTLPLSVPWSDQMAHKLLYKEMVNVNIMKLLQKYNNTVEAVFSRRALLFSAHNLAMDTKNLLNMIDSIHISYPMVDQMITHSANLASAPAKSCLYFSSFSHKLNIVKTLYYDS